MSIIDVVSLTATRLEGETLPAASLARRRGIEMNDRWVGGWINLPCPRCGAEFSVEENGDAVTVFPDRDDYDSPIGTRGGYVNIDLWCSGCGCKFTITIGNHKGSQVLAYSRDLDEREVMRGLCESPIEESFWDAYIKHPRQELEGLRPQVEVGAYRVDFGIPDRRLAIELDGFEYHSSREHMANDRKRQRDLETEGWRVCRFSGREVHRDAVGCVVESAKWASAQA